jgi:hypothetical protein
MPQHLLTLRAFKRVGAEVGFYCRCGVKKTALARELIRTFPDYTDPNDIARRMRCRSCGKRAVRAYAVLPDGVLQERMPFKAVWGFGAGDKE